MAFYKGQPDIIIRNGTIVDGTGKLPYFADIAIIGDKIDYIGNLKGVSAPLEIDAHHKYVTPGFIDSHTHADRTIFKYPECQNALRQGVTTQIMGNCGRTYLHTEPSADGTYPKGTMAAVLDQLEEAGASMNSAWLCGHNTLRQMANLYTTDYTENSLRLWPPSCGKPWKLALLVSPPAWNLCRVWSADRRKWKGWL